MLEDLELPKKVWPCKVRTLKADMSDKDAEILENVLLNPDWPIRTLSNELKKRDIEISETAIKSHREKRCSCWKI